MYIFRVFFYLFTTLTLIQSQKLNLLYDNTEKSSVYCVVSQKNENSAIGLFENNKPVKSYKYKTNLSKLTNNLFCDISVNKTCNDILHNRGGWKYDISNNYDLPRVTDKRWEDFAVIESGRTYFINVYNVTNKKKPLRLNLSVKIEKDAYIYLCDGMDPLNSNCHWFVIGGWKKNDTSKSIAQICKKKELEKLYVEYIYGDKDQSCSKHPDNEIEPYTRTITPAFLSSSKWTSISLEESNKSYSIKFRRNHTELIRSKNLVNFTIDVKHIFIASPSSAPGEWKVNKTKFNTGVLQTIYRFDGKVKSSFYFSLIHPEDFRNNNDNKKEYKTYIKICKDICNNSFPNTTITVEEKSISNWTHFNLQLYNSTVKLFREDKTSSTTSFNFIPKYILISSRKIAYWKKHDYGIFVAKNRSTLVIPFAEGIKGQRICIAIFVYCGKCNLSFEIIDSEKTTLIKTTYSKQKSWEQVELATILKKDAKMELKIILDKANSSNPAFIGDITDCTENVRILKAISAKPDQISCKPLNNASIAATKNQIVITSSFENTFDALWLSKNNSCQGIARKQALEDELKCSMTTVNYDKFIHGKEMCFLKIKKNNSSCEVLTTESKSLKNPINYANLLLILPIIILLGCIGSFVYFFKKYIQNSHTLSRSWMYIRPNRVYSLVRINMFRQNSSENANVKKHDSSPK